MSTPVNNNPPNNANNPTSDPITAPVTYSSQFLQDEISAQNMDWFAITSTASSKNKEKLFQVQQDNARQEKDAWSGVTEQSFLLSQLRQAILDQGQLWLDVCDDQTQEQQLINTYHSNKNALQGAVTNLNLVINHYHGNPPTNPPTTLADLQAAVNTYNQDPAVQSQLNYQEVTGGLNQTLQQVSTINAVRAGFGMTPPLSTDMAQTSTVPGFIDPNSAANLQALPLVNDIPDITISQAPPFTNPVEAVALYLTDSLRQGIIFNPAIIINQLKQNALVVQRLNALNPNSPSTPLAHTLKKFSGAFSDTSATSVSQPTSSSLISIGAGTASPILDRLFSDSLYQALSELSHKIPPEVIEKIHTFLLALLTKAAKHAAVTASAQLSGQQADNNIGPYFRAESAVDFADEIHNAIASGVISDFILKNVVSNNPDLQGFSQAELGPLASALTAIADTSLSNVALTNLAVSLNEPGLVPQVFGNITGIPPISQLLEPTVGSQISQALNEPTTTKFSKQAVSSDLAALGVQNSDEEANKVVNQVIIDQKSINSVQDLHDEFVKAFTNVPGVSAEQANTLADNAVAFYQKEIKLPFLNDAYVAGSAATLASEVHGPNSNQVVAALDVLSTQNFLLVRDFDTALRNQLVSQGLSKEQADTLATNTVGLLRPAPSSNPLVNIQPTRVLSRSEITEAVSSSIQENPALQGTPNNGLAAHASTAVRNLINDYSDDYGKLKSLQREQFISQDVIDEFHGNVAALSAAPAPLFAVSNSIASTISSRVDGVVTRNASIMTMDISPLPKPGGVGPYKRSIDINV